jgi:hypothetical protein
MPQRNRGDWAPGRRARGPGNRGRAASHHRGLGPWDHVPSRRRHHGLAPGGHLSGARTDDGDPRLPRSALVCCRGLRRPGRGLVRVPSARCWRRGPAFAPGAPGHRGARARRADFRVRRRRRCLQRARGQSSFRRLSHPADGLRRPRLPGSPSRGSLSPGSPSPGSLCHGSLSRGCLSRGRFPGPRLCHPVTGWRPLWCRLPGSACSWCSGGHGRSGHRHRTPVGSAWSHLSHRRLDSVRNRGRL